MASFDGCSDSVQLQVPAGDLADPEITILVPALNEELTIGQFVDWCKEGITTAQVRAEILIVDSSTDRTTEIALARGARVLKTPRRGLGRAYIDAVPHVRGRYIIMGDADCTYDFRVIKPFVDAYRAGAEFVMGSRFMGSIAPGAMPGLHRYFGSPLTTFLLNLIVGGRFSDIHCGMRGITRDALTRMDLRSQGWEYASEMILKSVHMGLMIKQVPIHFLKDPAGRLSHMRRRGWTEPWRAGWMNLRMILTYGVDFFLLKPGAVLLMLGLMVLVALSSGPVSIGPFTFSLDAMLLALTVATFGLSMVFCGLLARALFDYSGKLQSRIVSMLPFTRSAILCSLGFLAGIFLMLPMMRGCPVGNCAPQGVGIYAHWAVLGLWLICAAFQTFIFGSVIRALDAVLPKRPRGRDD
jgi:hypothetical protein